MRFSYSSFNCFDRCKRQYYYTQIAANHKAKNDILRKEAHYLKQLTSAQFWPGKLVEATIEDVIVEGRINPSSGNIVHVLFEYARSLAENQFKKNGVSYREWFASRKNFLYTHGICKKGDFLTPIAYDIASPGYDEEEETKEEFFNNNVIRMVS
jgi:hypothetical protein